MFKNSPPTDRSVKLVSQEISFLGLRVTTYHPSQTVDAKAKKLMKSENVVIKNESPALAC
jgi:hypothetical protein